MMNEQELQQWCIDQTEAPQIIDITEEMYNSLNKEQAEQILLTLGGAKMIRLPEREITFFEWVKINDREVWDDLWGDDLFEPYYVSINILPYLIAENDNGFPICDLESTTNYFFSLQFMQDAESEVLLDAARSRLLEKQFVSIAHKLALEISIAPIDLWHFAYKYKISIADAKKAVEELVEDDALVHLKEAEHIAMAMQI